MNTELKDKIQEEVDKLQQDIRKRDITPNAVTRTLKNSINGLVCYAKEGRSIVFYLLGLIFEILMGIIYNINGLEWILIICIMGILLSVELLNTGLEAACDAITKEYNPLIKIAKDCGSAATFVIFTVAIILNLIIFVPKVFLIM